MKPKKGGFKRHLRLTPSYDFVRNLCDLLYFFVLFNTILEPSSRWRETEPFSSFKRPDVLGNGGSHKIQGLNFVYFSLLYTVGKVLWLLRVCIRRTDYFLEYNVKF